MPLISAGIGLLAGGTFLSGLGGFLLKTAVGIGLNLLAQKIAGKGNNQPGFSMEGALRGGGDLARSIALGYCATAGSLVYANTWGVSGKTPNAYLTQVIALADYPVKGFGNIWVHNEKVTLGTPAHSTLGYPVLEYRDSGKDHLWIKLYDGYQTTADTLLTSTVTSEERPYQSTRVGRGVAYAVCTAMVHEELFQGMPEFKFELLGSKLYDPSKDSSVGGSGTQRLNDSDTWGGDGDDLPAVQLYNLLLGINYGTNWLYGLQAMTQARLPTANWIAQINKCRALIAGPDGNEATYRAGGEIKVEVPIADTVDAILTACQGRLCESGGQYFLFVGEPDSPVATIDDGVILSTEEQTFTPFFGLADTVTGINATYPRPVEGWGAKIAPPLISSSLETPAGGRRMLADVRLDLVPYDGQVQRLMKSALAEAQRARRHTIVVPSQYWTLLPGEIVSWTSARNGYISKLFRVDGVIDRDNLDVLLDLTEVDPSDYDWNQSTDYRTPVDGSLGVQRVPPQVISGFGVEPANVLDEDSNPRRPAIRLYWDWDDEDVDIEAVKFTVRLAADLTTVFTGRTDRPEAGEVIIAPFSILPNTEYEVDAEFVSISKNRPMESSGWLPVTTPDTRLGQFDIYLPGMVAEIIEFISKAQGHIGAELREFIDEARRLTTTILDQEVGDYIHRQQIRTEMSASFGKSRAEYLRAINLAVGPNSAIVQSIEDLRAEVFDPTTGLPATANAVTVLTARVGVNEGDIESLADAIIALTASYNSISATANMRMTASAGPSGYSSRIGLEARVGGSGTFRSASLFIDVPASSASPTRVAIVADQFVVSSGTTHVQPLVFDGTTLRLAGGIRAQWANISDVVTANFVAGTANIGTAAITSAKIGDLEVDTIKIKNQAVTEFNSASYTIPSNIGWTTIFTMSVPLNGGFLLTQNEYGLGSSGGGSGVRALLNGSQLWIDESSGGVSGNEFDMFGLGSGGGTVSYTVQVRGVSGSITTKAMVAKK